MMNELDISMEGSDSEGKYYWLVAKEQSRLVSNVRTVDTSKARTVSVECVSRECRPTMRITFEGSVDDDDYHYPELLLLTNMGRVYRLKAYEYPEVLVPQEVNKLS